jgi:hypothetical protein
MTAPSHEQTPGDEQRDAMLKRLTELERTLQGNQGPTLVHAKVAIETLRARLLGLVR